MNHARHLGIYYSAMIELITNNLKAIAELCVQYGVSRLEVFGSAVRADFDSTVSDLDFAVEFLPRPRSGLDDNYFKLRTALEQLLGRPVDLVEAGCVSNPVVAAAIERGKVPVYAAA